MLEMSKNPYKFAPYINKELDYIKWDAHLNTERPLS